MELDELAVPVEEGVGVGVLQGCVGGGVGGFGWGAGLPLGGGGGASQTMRGVAGVDSVDCAVATPSSWP